MQQAGNAGRLKDLVNNADTELFRYKTIRPGARGRKPLSPTKKVRCWFSINVTLLLYTLLNTFVGSQMEHELLGWCKRQWDRRKVVTRGIIFRKAIQLHPAHCGGKADPNVFARLKNGFTVGSMSGAVFPKGVYPRQVRNYPEIGRRRVQGYPTEWLARRCHLSVLMGLSARA